MNRIILIGNGFDLAHGLQTSYANFIEGYFDSIRLELGRCTSNILDDGLYKITLKNNGMFGSLDMLAITPETPDSEIWRQYLAQNQQTNYVTIEKGILMRNITQSIVNKQWVDIENEYYSLLKI